MSLKGVERTADAQGNEVMSTGSAARTEGRKGLGRQSTRLADADEPVIPISQTGN